MTPDSLDSDLGHLLDAEGYATVSLSSFHTPDESHPPPRILAGNGVRLYAIHIEGLRDERAIISERSLDGLVHYARQFGARARIAIPVSDGNWFFVHPEDLYGPDDHEYHINEVTVKRRGSTLGELTP